MLRAGIDGVVPLLSVAVVRRARVRGRVRLALVFALLVIDDLRTLAAACDQQGDDGEGSEPGGACAHHDLVPPAGGGAVGATPGAAPGAPGWPPDGGSLYAVAQPHTSPPLPRRRTRSR